LYDEEAKIFAGENLLEIGEIYVINSCNSLLNKLTNSKGIRRFITSKQTTIVTVSSITVDMSSALLPYLNSPALIPAPSAELPEGR
jgi:hypothetical protein